MKRIHSIIMAVLLAVLAACGTSVQAETKEAEATADEQKESAESTGTSKSESDATDKAEHSDVLVAYFSATGTTKGVAEKIASVTGGDLYEILAAEPYTTDDLNYNDSSTLIRQGTVLCLVFQIVTSKLQSQKARPYIHTTESGIITDLS